MRSAPVSLTPSFAVSSSPSSSIRWNTYVAAGRYQDAEPRFQEILAKRSRVLGRDHPDTLRSRSSLANTFAALARHNEAAVLHHQIIEDRVRVLGPDHLRTELSRKRLETARRAAHFK